MVKVPRHRQTTGTIKYEHHKYCGHDILYWSTGHKDMSLTWNLHRLSEKGYISQLTFSRVLLCKMNANIFSSNVLANKMCNIVIDKSFTVTCHCLHACKLLMALSTIQKCAYKKCFTKNTNYNMLLSMIYIFFS